MSHHRAVVADRPALVDPFGRHIDYLRVSVTDRCNYRCTYCMGDHPTFLPKAEVLDLDELDRLISAFVRRGIRRVRLTGGEPLARRGIVGLVAGLARHLDGGGLDEITMTTNGSLLDRFAGDLAAAGLRRVNVSLDTLDPARFADVTRRGDLAEVLAGIAAARAAGLAVKINAVVQTGVNDGAIDDLLAFAHDGGMDLALIETMPIGRIGGDRAARHLTLDRVRADLERRFTLIDLPERSGGPARYVRVRETGGRIAFITPLSHGFCGECNRVRITCDGRLTLCLGRESAVDLRAVLRGSEGDAALSAAIDAAIARKPQGHDFAHAPFAAVARGMNLTGG
ncbi:GTP 3',8-cyclase MoaA [Siculibacillus lacustris]|uniref:GTP 3',8-cyclase n=1 Tax=Siculibacillus lacustris TaxID=1549641 RepID=A0A4Q9VVN4_9HYPH|nr:GTP 3',8-cyclase MoaA [Siculibacillus lacustris]TBW40319.1 GTP 3',8-cyclase MoaA [Siculibacillus lacustris]